MRYQAMRPVEKSEQIGKLLSEIVGELDQRIAALEQAQPPEPPEPPEPGKLHSIGSWYIDENLKDKLKLDMAIGMIAPDNPANLDYLVNTLKLKRVNALIYGPHLSLLRDKLEQGLSERINLGWSPQQMLQAAETIGKFSADHSH